VTIAYVLINCELGAEETIMEKLNEIEQVKEVFGTIGTHDMMVKIDAENFEKVRDIVSRNIQKIEKIRTISTLVKKDN
jgi:DNA-binding Lrp family transcriptional regulator